MNKHLGDSVELPLIEGAQRLGLSYNQMLRVVLKGAVRGVRTNGRWMVSEADVQRQAAEQKRAR